MTGARACKCHDEHGPWTGPDFHREYELLSRSGSDVLLGSSNNSSDNNKNSQKQKHATNITGPAHASKRMPCQDNRLRTRTFPPGRHSKLLNISLVACCCSTVVGRHRRCYQAPRRTWCPWVCGRGDKYIRTCIGVCMCVCMCVYIYYIYIIQHLYIERIFKHQHRHMYVYMYIHLYIYVYTHTYATQHIQPYTYTYA